MVKPATKWLRGLLRAGKAQQRTASKLAKVLFGPVPAKPKPRSKAAAKPKTVAKTVAKPKVASKPARQAGAKPRARPAFMFTVCSLK